MVSMHELAEIETDGSGPDVEFVQGKTDEVVVVRCPSCKGLRGISARHVSRNGKLCTDCKGGKVIKKSQFHNYWTARFSTEEIQEMASAIWG